ncbi:formylmethanofuran dehydrogenase, subunit B [Leptolyngbyaceae cyanobacterium JSC-12]|nr:formylmethanofuran dehydrogenase, subunit B [Leptolyngbyaceae cyanobacterium JSC-12]
MSYSLTQTQSEILQECLEMAQDLALHPDAERRFLDLEETLPDDPPTVEVLETLWREVLAARRSALYWQQVSDVERSLTEKLADNHFQLQQNYLRLMQEQ